MQLFTPATAFDAYRADYAAAQSIADQIMISDYGLHGTAATGPSHRADVFATLTARLPTLVGEVAIRLARGEEAEAVAFVRDALKALKATDGQLFEPSPTKAEFIKLLRKMSPPSVARGHAARTGVEEARRESYVLFHKFAGEEFIRRNVPEVERRSGVIGLPMVAARLALDSEMNPTVVERIGRWLAPTDVDVDVDASAPTAKETT